MYEVSITITAAGAQGGSASDGSAGGLGAVMTGTFTVTPGDSIYMLAGGVGGNTTGSWAGGGGGGTFVYDSTSHTLLIAAGGGGGAGVSGDNANSNASVTTTALAGSGGGALAGTPAGDGGSASTYGGGGAGWLTSGANLEVVAQVVQSFIPPVLVVPVQMAAEAVDMAVAP